MKWSQLPRRKQQLYVSTGVLAFAVIFGLAAVSQNRQVGADTTTTAVPDLDSTGFANTKDVRFKTVDASGNPVSAFIDAYTLGSQEGVVAETDDKGEGVATLPDATCIAAQASDKASDATGAVIVAVGLTAADCDPTAVAAPATTTEAVTITVK